MKAPKRLLNTTEVTTCRDGVETYDIKMLNSLISYSRQIFKQKPLFFITQDCVNQRKSLYYLNVSHGNIFHHFDESPGKYYGKIRQVETKPVNK